MILDTSRNIRIVKERVAFLPHYTAISVPRLTIQKLSPRHAESALQVFRDSLTLLDDERYPHAVITAILGFYTTERLKRIFSNPDRRVLGAWSGNRLVGCLWGYRSALDGTCSIDWVVVSPRMVGKGVFSRLMKAIEAKMRRERVFKICFYVSAKNIPAIMRYSKLGYTIEGVHRNHFFGWDFISMGKILTRKRWKGRIANQPDSTEVIDEIRR
jgi:GNAT superfamily N-acetyltransferase